jgi:flagellar hook-length control protein FliK
MNNEHGMNMDNNLNFSSTSIANPLSTAAPAATPGVDDSLSTPMNGKEFAGLMRDLLSKSGRQELAASGLEGSELEADTKCLEAPATGLLTLNLGDQFAVITTTSPLPDGNSLAAFARAQGLGESAVKALFGDLIAMPSDALSAAVTATPIMDLANAMTAPALTASPSLLSVGIAIDPQLVNAPATFNWLSAHPGALPTVPTVPNVPQVASAVMSQYANMTLDSQALAPENTSKVSNLDKLLTATGATAVIQTLGIATPLSGLAPTATLTAAELHAEMGPLDAMRMRLVPAWETMTQQLAKLNGNLKGTTWAELMSTKLAEKSPIGESTSTLNLGSTDIGLDLGADLTLAMAAGASDNVSATPLNASDNTKAPVSLSAIANSSLTAQGEKAEMADRAEQIQQLANKLGQALGERLQEQMERGQWRLHLKLNPGHLGQIDVELDMRAGGLDAIFRTENMLTKELILQGASKLKESLAQSGTTVADVWVNSDSKRQSGGNPTPQRFTDNSDTEPESKVNQPPQRANTLIEKRSADAWDTLA